MLHQNVVNYESKHNCQFYLLRLKNLQYLGYTPFCTNCNKYDNCAIENCRSRKNKIYKASHFKVHWVEYLVCI